MIFFVRIAYIDTKLGQLMINTDYWLKALWHGKCFFFKYHFLLNIGKNQSFLLLNEFEA